MKDKKSTLFFRFSRNFLGQKRHFWLVVSGTVYLVVLICRIWGAHRFLHYEESVLVGSTRSETFFAVLNDNSYGSIVQRATVEFSAWFRLAITPNLLVGSSILIWLSCTMFILRALFQNGSGNLPAFFGPLALCLLPLPDGAFMGLVSNVGFPIGVLVVTLVIVSKSSANVRDRVVEFALLITAAASTPTALVALPILLTWLVLNIGDQWINIDRLLAIILGASILLLLYLVQEPTMTYLEDWEPTETYEREVLSRLTESGSFEVRARASVGLGELIKNLPGSIRFVVTQMYPEPWASRAILETQGLAKLMQVVVPVFLVVLLVLLITRVHKSPVDRSIIMLANGLFFGSIVSVLVQHVLVGQLTLRQYLFLPVTMFWMGILVLLGGALASRSRTALLLLAPFIVCFALAVWQNFRDPFQENPRQGGMGRYASHEIWRPALDVARNKCQDMSDKAFVVVTQVDPNDPTIKRLIQSSGLKLAWFDHPFIARCDVIKKG